jgi:uncharacterized protein DUF4350
MTVTDTSVTPTIRQRWRVARSVIWALILVSVVASVGTWLTSPRPGGPMDPASTSPDGTHALVALLRDHGVDVIVADDIAAVERAAAPNTLVVTLQTSHLVDDDLLRRLAAVPGDRLLVAPTSRTREVLSPEIRRGAESTMGGEPECDLREATQAGDVQLGGSDTFTAKDDDIQLTSCYEGALVRYTNGGQAVTVVGGGDFMTNSGLLKQGNAALAMNLAGDQPRVVWYAPQHTEGESSGAATISDLIPDAVRWIVFQLCVAVLLLALWKGRRIGPLVAEKLPVVVRASETVEGRGRLYRSHRASDRAADALRTAALQRLLPRLGLDPNAGSAAIVQAIVARSGQSPEALAHTLFGPPPATDADLVNLANALDDIERQVAQS